MGGEDDIYRIHIKEKEEYRIRVMENLNTLHLHYEFETFEEWKKEREY